MRSNHGKETQERLVKALGRMDAGGDDIDVEIQLAEFHHIFAELIKTQLEWLGRKSDWGV